MTIDRLTFLQDRMGRSYQEQVWAVSIVAGMNGLVIGQAKLLASALRPSAIVACLVVISLLALLFVWSRFAIYRHYEALIQKLISSGPDATFFELTAFQKVSKRIVGWSGTILYSVIILALAWASISVVIGPKPLAS